MEDLCKSMDDQHKQREAEAVPPEEIIKDVPESLAKGTQINTQLPKPSKSQTEENIDAVIAAPEFTGENTVNGKEQDDPMETDILEPSNGITEVNGADGNDSQAMETDASVPETTATGLPVPCGDDASYVQDQKNTENAVSQDVHGVENLVMKSADIPEETSHLTISEVKGADELTNAELAEADNMIDVTQDREETSGVGSSDTSDQIVNNEFQENSENSNSLRKTETMESTTDNTVEEEAENTSDETQDADKSSVINEPNNRVSENVEADKSNRTSNKDIARETTNDTAEVTENTVIPQPDQDIKQTTDNTDASNSSEVNEAVASDAADEQVQASSGDQDTAQQNDITAGTDASQTEAQTGNEMPDDCTEPHPIEIGTVVSLSGKNSLQDMPVESATDVESQPAGSTSKEAGSTQVAVKSEVAQRHQDVELVILDQSTEPKSRTPEIKKEPVDNASTSPPSLKKASQQCLVCQKLGKCKFNIVRNGDTKHLCDDACFKEFKQNPTKYLKKNQKRVENYKKETSEEMNNFLLSEKFCYACSVLITDISNAATAAIGDTMRHFCGENCKKRYAMENDDNDDIEIIGTSNLGNNKNKAPQCSMCKKRGQVKHEIHLHGSKHNLCSNECFSSFSKQNKLAFDVCEQCGKPCHKTTNSAQSIQFEGQTKLFCSVICLNVFKTTKQKIVACAWCSTKKSNFDMVERMDANNRCQLFCTLNCLSLYRVNLQATSQNMMLCDQCSKLAPAQYHLTMSDASVRNFCSYNCVVVFQKQFIAPSNNTGLSTNQIHQNVSAQENTVVSQQPRQANRHIAKGKTNQGNSTIPAPVRHSSRPRKPSHKLKTLSSATSMQIVTSGNIPIISNVVSLAPPPSTPPATLGRGRGRPPKKAKSQQPAAPYTSPPMIQPATSVVMPSVITTVSPGTPSMTQVKQKLVIQYPEPKQCKNKGLQARPPSQTKATSCRPHSTSISTQTDEEMTGFTPKGLIPVPIPVYVPLPMKMYSHPVPYPIPIPVPIPVPMFIPTTKKSANGILKHIKELQEKIPEDPFEAELLQMAEAVANADKQVQSSSDSEDDNTDTTLKKSDGLASLPSLTNALVSNDLGEDLVQAAFRLSEGFNEPAMDLEDSLEPTTINPAEKEPPQQFNSLDEDEEVFSTPKVTRQSQKRRGRGRGRGRGSAKRRKIEEPVYEEESTSNSPQPMPSDASFSLKFTYGVNAWKHWVIQKNAQLEKEGAPRGGSVKCFKTDILSCSSEDLNRGLCMFVKEVRKPNGEKYAADSIYYLCLGIQQYMFENGRIDNIFTDWYFETFTLCLNEVLANFEARLNRQGLLVCRIEEEHLWECKQLGAHSPHVLLMTLIYFNTKHFMLRTPEDHLRLSFSHVVKHWKKSNSSKNGGRSVYLRYYSPAMAADSGSKRKKEDSITYEQIENTENPLRCPVKLYEFYLSKCPESIRNRSDVFYLIPERSCVPDSPVWYSTMNLNSEAMVQMLNRVRVVREIQETFIHSPANHS